MSDKDTVILQELLIELPPGASLNQADCKPGYYRTMNGRQKKISSTRTQLTVKRHTVDLMNFAPVGTHTRLVPLGEEIIIQCDRFMDEATCKACRGAGHSDFVCTECGGSKVWYVDEHGNRDKRASADRSLLTKQHCPACYASEASSPLRRSTGYQPCKPCGGTGQAGVGQSKIAAVTDRQDEPTTGIILAIGPQVTRLDRGDRVMFSRYAGITYEYDKRSYRVMKQQYPIAKVIGQGDVYAKES